MVNRQQFGHVISKTFRGVRRINQSQYFVKSQSGNGKYEVSLTKIGWLCSCADHKFRGIRCKHVYAVEFSFAIRETVQQEVVIQPISQLACRYCNSEHIVKKAIRRNKQYNIQRYLCKIAVNDSRLILGFEKMRAPTDAITSAMQLYFTGESFRNVMRFLELRGGGSCKSCRGLQMDS